ncbi:MFS transporter [Candidatus Gracilibacteria bacterium]|nr:MFS transporter [Candidatus Gracilibacteria bacterium]
MDKEIVEVSFFQFFANLGRNIIMLVLPFYLYRVVGYEMWQICMFFLFWQLGFTVTIPFAGEFLTRFGLKHSMALRSIGVSMFWVAISFFIRGDFWSDMLFMIPFFLLNAYAKAVSEIAYDIFLSYYLSRGSGGKTIAWMQIAIMTAVIIAPLAGGLLMKSYGFSWVAYTTAFFYLLSGVVLLLTPDHKFHVSYTPTRLLADTFKKTDKTLIIAEFGRVFFDAVLWVVWPIFLLLVLKNVVSIGAVVAISSLLSMIASLIIGKKIDKLGINPRSFRFGAYRSTFLNFLRGVVWDPIALAIIDALHKINFGVMKVPYTVQIYKWLHKQDTFERAHIRWMIAENIYMIAILIFTGLFFLFADNFKMVFAGIFAVGSVTMLLTQVVSKFTDD